MDKQKNHKNEIHLSDSKYTGGEDRIESAKVIHNIPEPRGRYGQQIDSDIEGDY